MLGEHEGFVARLGRVHVELLPVGDNADVAAPLRTVAAVQDDDAISHVADRRRQVLCGRRLARAADRDVAEADDVAGEMLALEKSRLVAPEFQVHELAVDEGKTVERPHDDAQTKAIGMTAAHEVGDIGAEVFNALRRAHLARILALLEVLQEVMQEHSRLSGRALVLADDGERLALHAPPFPFVLKEPADSCGKFFSIVHRDAGVPLREEYMCILEVEHVVPDDDRLAVRRRLQDVVTAVRDEAAADVDDVADAIDLAELTDRIEDHNVVIFARLFQKFCTARDGKSLVPAERGDFRRAQKLPRRNDELGLGELFPECGKRLEDGRLLTAMRAACEKNATILAKSHFTQELFLLREAHVRVRLIEFRIPRDGHKLGRCAEAHDVLGVDG